MPVSNAQLTQMFEHVLKLSRVDETQSVAVLKSHYSDPRTVNAAMEAVIRRAPGQYLWGYHRYKQPRGDAAPAEPAAGGAA